MQGAARVIIEEEGDVLVYRTETDPPLVGRGETPREALTRLKDKIRVAIKEGAFDGEAWQPFLSRDQLEKFEDVVVEGIGNVKDLADKTVNEIRTMLAPDRHCLYSSITPVPEGWPAEVIDLFPDTDGDICQFWNMDAGKGWQQFYIFSLTASRDEHGMEPAFIYERKTGEDADTCLPIVSLMFSREGRCMSASKHWCDMVRQQERGARRRRFSGDVRSVFRAAFGIAVEAGRDEISLEDIERAVKRPGNPDAQPARYRPLPFQQDVVDLLREACKLADAAGADNVGIEQIVKAAAASREGRTE